MTEEPRARFRELPDPVRPEDTVETADVTAPPAGEGEVQKAWRTALLGAGG